MGMNRDELLTKLAMELAEWPVNTESPMPEDFVFHGPKVGAWGEHSRDAFSEREWLQRRAELINKPSWDSHEWPQIAQDDSGNWWGVNDEFKMTISRDFKGDTLWIKRGEGEYLCSHQSRVWPIAGHDWRQTLERRPTESKEGGVIYAINKRTKEHRIKDPLTLYSTAKWDEVQADAGGWIPWEGGECPLQDGVKFQYTLREGSVIDFDEASEIRWWHATRNDSRALSGVDIIAYRPILDEPSEAEAVEWDDEGLPPVGCECECTFSVENHDTWHKGVVALRGVAPEGHEIVAIDTGDYTAIYRSTQFIRPIRSEQDRLIDEALDVLGADGDDKRTIYSAVRSMIYAGYRKQEAE